MAIEMQSVINGFLEGSIRTTGREPVINELIVSENGTYIAPSDIDGYNPVIVNVPKTPLNKLTVTENGTYTAPTETGYNEVNVNVPLPSNTYLLKEIEDVDIASFSDGANLPMPSLKVGIEPIQEGSGDPSPTNIRPISGWDECNVTRKGKNLFNGKLKNGYIYNGTYYASDAYWCNEEPIPVIPNNPFIFSGVVSNGQICCFDSDNHYTGDVFSPNASFVTPSNCYYISIYNPISTKDNNKQLELGNQATAYEPYNGQTYTIDLDGTRYGGTLDVVSGELKVVPYYASYNGETLEGEWISDRDVYAVGTTPTIGAQVVNTGATPQVIQLTPTQIKTLLGNNVITADTGSINNIEYFAK